MKQLVALAALAGLLIISGCAPQPEPRGGAFDNSLTDPGDIPTREGGHYDPATRRPEPDIRVPMPGTAPSNVIPEGEPDSSPEFMLPRGKGQVYSI